MPEFNAIEFALSPAEAKSVRSSLTGIGLGQSREYLWFTVAAASLYMILAAVRLAFVQREPFSIGLAIFQVATGLAMVGIASLQFGRPRLLPAAGLDARAEVNATGLSLRVAGGIVDLPWHRIERVVAFEDTFVFVSSMPWTWKPIVVLPRRALAPGEAERLWTFVDDHMTAKRGIVRGVEFVRPTIFNTLAQKR